MKLRRRAKESRGASAVEMALIAPLFIMLVLGQIETSRLGMVSQLLTTAAREGCRVAVIPNKSQSDVQDRIDSVLSGSGITIGTVTPTCPSPHEWDTAPAGTPISVHLSVSYSSVSWLGTPFFLKDANVVASATMSSERP